MIPWWWVIPAMAVGTGWGVLLVYIIDRIGNELAEHDRDRDL